MRDRLPGSRGHQGRHSHKHAFTIPDRLAEDIEAEAERQQRSSSWIVRQALAAGLPVVRAFPPAGEPARDEARDLLRQEEKAPE